MKEKLKSVGMKPADILLPKDCDKIGRASCRERVSFAV